MRIKLNRCTLVMVILLNWACEDTSPKSSQTNDFSVSHDRSDSEQEIRNPQTPISDQNLRNTADSLLDFDLSPKPESALNPTLGEGIFRAGCPKVGFAHARVLQGPSLIKGEAVIGDIGDLILMNNRVAYVIQNPTQDSRTWWYYGGQIVDAVPLKDCQQAEEDRLNSLGTVVGEGEITAIDQAVMRAFKGERAEIIHNGDGGGEVRVRVYGIDAPMWLVEAELMSMALKAGRPKLKSEELGLDLWIDYVLAPDDNVIQIEFGASNLLDVSRTLRMSALTFFGDKAFTQRFSPSDLRVGGIRLHTGLPWLSSGNMALALKSNNMATAHFAGVDLFIDVTRFISGDQFSALQEGTLEQDHLERIGVSDTSVWTMYFTVHQEGLSAASEALSIYQDNPALGRLHRVESTPISMHYSNQESEAFQSQVQSPPPLLPTRQRKDRIELWVLAQHEDTSLYQLGQVGEQWLTAQNLESNEVFQLKLPGLLKANEFYQARIIVAGSPEIRTAAFDLNTIQNNLLDLNDLVLPARGRLDVQILDQDGQAMPASLRLHPIISEESHAEFSLHRHSELLHVIEAESFWIAPGQYTYSLSRGYQYEPINGELEILAGESTSLTLALSRQNPIPNYLSFDAHVHAGPSPDSDVLINDRLRGAAAEGVDIVAGSDHEIITDWSLSMQDSLRPWVLPIISEEATAGLPEHMNIYPLPARSDRLRGEPPRWYGLGFDRFIEELSHRGAQIIQLNHPRQGCNYLCIIGYDRESGEIDPSLNPMNFGYDEGELWDWGFNAVELLNDPRPIFIDLDDPYSTGYYEDWASFINLGHKVTGMGVSDIHGPDGIGAPVTLVQVKDDDSLALISETEPNDLAEAIIKGKAQVSLGAWVDLKVNGMGLGELVSGQAIPNSESQGIEAQSRFNIELSVRALPSVDVTWIYLFINCDVYASWEATNPYETLKYQRSYQLDLSQDAWMSIMAFGDDQMPTGLVNYDPRVTPRVVTNPIYLDSDQDGQWTSPGGKTCIIPEGRRP